MEKGLLNNDKSIIFAFGNLYRCSDLHSAIQSCPLDAYIMQFAVFSWKYSETNRFYARKIYVISLFCCFHA